MSPFITEGDIYKNYYLSRREILENTQLSTRNSQPPVNYSREKVNSNHSISFLPLGGLSGERRGWFKEVVPSCSREV